jgi:hypothetical protein
MQNTARRIIAYPDLTRGDRPDVPAHLYNLATKLDVDVLYQQGTDAQRGASGYQVGGGRFWWTTDTNLLWYDDGNNWHVVSTSLTGAILATIYDAKGDLIAGTGPDTYARLPVGTDGFTLVADSSQTTGLRWQAAGDWITISQPAAYQSADGPTFVMTVAGIDLTSRISPKTRIQILQTTTKYFIVTAVSAAGGNTTITMYGGNNYVLANAAISTFAFSNLESPPGFPNQADLWTVVIEDQTAKTVNNPTQNAWVNPVLGISIPIGSWDLRYKVHVRSQYSSPQGEMTIGATLSTTTNSETDHRLTSGAHTGNSDNSANKHGSDLMNSKLITVATKTLYNLLLKAYDNNCSFIAANGALCGSTILEARCAYL